MKVQIEIKKTYEILRKDYDIAGFFSDEEVMDMFKTDLVEDLKFLDIKKEEIKIGTVS